MARGPAAAYSGVRDERAGRRRSPWPRCHATWAFVLKPPTPWPRPFSPVGS